MNFVDDDTGDLGLARHPDLPSPVLPAPAIPDARRSRPSPLSVPRTNSKSLTSPSSPDLTRSNVSTNIDPPDSESLASPSRTSTLARARTLPKARQSSAAGLRTTTSLDEDVDPTPLDPGKLDHMQRWITGLAIINFDLDIGPVVSMLYPNLPLSASERENIAFSSFPDTARFETGSETHSFRVRYPATLEASQPSTSDGFLYGYVRFLQARDTTSKRGYLQRSVVILSHLPFLSLFITALDQLAPLYFSQGAPSLETACHNIASWPQPSLGTQCELGFMGVVFTITIPQNIIYQQSPTAPSPLTDGIVQVCAPPSSPSPMQLFAAVLPKLWSIWECLILGDPFLLFAPSPREASLAVWWLVDLMKPLSTALDYRPYFHIHDQDCEQLVNKNQPRQGILIGVTNPFFESRCKHWPHILSLGSPNSSGSFQKGSKPSNSNMNGQFGPPPGFHSKHQRYTSKDRQVLKTLETAYEAGGNVELQATHLLRRHFATRASELLVPLNRYFTSLISTNNHSAAQHATPPTLKAFNASEFLMSLKTHGTPLSFRSKTKQRDFYERWIKSPAFGVWLRDRDKETREALDMSAR